MTLGSTLLRARKTDGPLGDIGRWETLDRLSRGVFACSVFALDPVWVKAEGDDRFNGAEALPLSGAGAGGAGAGLSCGVVVFACSIPALDPVLLIAKGDDRLDGAEALRFSGAGAGAGAGPDPQSGDTSRAETMVGGSGGLLLEVDLCLPPR